MKDLKRVRESSIERKLVEGLERRGDFCRKWVSPGYTGVPDRIAIISRGRVVHESELEYLPGGYVRLPGARVVFSELKRPTGSMSARQEYVSGVLKKLGAEVRPLWSVGQVHEFLDEVYSDDI